MILLSNIHPVARKQHTCMFCYGSIQKGQKYLKQTNIINGNFGEWKCHEECQDVAKRLGMYDDCDPDYGLNDEIFLDEIDNYIYANHYNKETDEIEADWQELTTHQKVLKILDELKKEENERRFARS